MTLASRGLLLVFAALPCRAADPAAARWEGTVHIPGREIRLVLDLAQDAQGRWTGSAILPDKGIKGAPLSDIEVHESAVSVTVKGLLGDPQLTGRLMPDGSLSGDLREGGNTAPFSLQRSGPPQVDPPRRSTAVPRELEGEWQGEMTLRGNPIHVKVTLTNHSGDGASAKLLLTGRREYPLDVDRVTEESGMLTLEVFAAGMTIEGRFGKESGEITGTFEQGPVDAALTLHRAR
ncbi:MAG TPA: hypothetical protein VG456_16370 [Candidatus Sulfopaludibacter sp.]|nr:hypothetical protein [Candidatus Sulfopaludibacter sp.]